MAPLSRLFAAAAVRLIGRFGGRLDHADRIGSRERILQCFLQRSFEALLYVLVVRFLRLIVAHAGVPVFHLLRAPSREVAKEVNAGAPPNVPRCVLAWTL